MRRTRVYFIHRADTNEIKIGISSDIVGRLRSFQIGCASSLVLLGSILGDEESEEAVDQAFAGCRLLGEWFTGTPELLAFVARVSGPPSEWAKRGRDADQIAIRHLDEALIELDEARNGHPAPKPLSSLKGKPLEGEK